jgi:cell division protein FtsB
MARLTKCKLNGRRLRLIRPWLMLRVLLLFALVSSLAFMQIYLRFCTRDMNIEMRKLQRKRVELANRRASLVAEVERLRRFDQDFQEYARSELGLVECPPERCKQTTVARSTLAHWQSIDRELSAPEKKQPSIEPSRVMRLARLGQHVVSWSSLSMASDSDMESDR